MCSSFWNTFELKRLSPAEIKPNNVPNALKSNRLYYLYFPNNNYDDPVQNNRSQNEWPVIVHDRVSCRSITGTDVQYTEQYTFLA